MTNLLRTFTLSMVVFFIGSCSTTPPPAGDKPPSLHGLWTQFLGNNVDESGRVNYKNAVSDTAILRKYLHELATSTPGPQWSTQDELAYYINLYNAATIWLVLQHYPIESIKDIGSSIQIPFVNTPWQIEFIQLGDNIYHLDDIEHGIIRKQFDVPEIHFALVCAAVSCPPLRNEAYTGEKLNQQLADQAFTFLSNPEKNDLNHQPWEVSRIFLWYGGDFTSKGGVKQYIMNTMGLSDRLDYDISYKSYDWSLNQQ